MIGSGVLMVVLVTVALAEVEVVPRGQECGGLQCGDTCLHLDKVQYSIVQYSTVQYSTV